MQAVFLVIAFVNFLDASSNLDVCSESFIKSSTCTSGWDSSSENSKSAGELLLENLESSSLALCSSSSSLFVAAGDGVVINGCPSKGKGSVSSLSNSFSIFTFIIRVYYGTGHTGLAA